MVSFAQKCAKGVATECHPYKAPTFGNFRCLLVGVALRGHPFVQSLNNGEGIDRGEASGAVLEWIAGAQGEEDA
jgi:hypothetical protein